VANKSFIADASYYQLKNAATGIRYAQSQPE
jgi:hypothetical protein